jgi:hypothetical protein
VGSNTNYSESSESGFFGGGKKICQVLDLPQFLTISFLLCTGKRCEHNEPMFSFMNPRLPLSLPFLLFLSLWSQEESPLSSQRTLVMDRPVLTIPPSVTGSVVQYFANRRCRTPPHRDRVWTRVYQKLFGPYDRPEAMLQAMRDMET